jgi:broad specificity phosphatase PhoE
MRLLIARHAVTDWNVQGRLQGRTDIDLNAKGIRQAGALAVRLGPERIDRLFSSPTRRATGTAMPIAGTHSLSLEIDENLHEGHMGLWEGLTWEEIAARYPGQILDRDRVGPSYKGHEGESILEVAARARRFYDRLRAEVPDAAVCIVTHAALARQLIVHAMGDDSHLKLRLRNASLSIVSIEAGIPRLECLDDVSHLEAPRSHSPT